MKINDRINIDVNNFYSGASFCSGTIKKLEPIGNTIIRYGILLDIDPIGFDLNSFPDKLLYFFKHEIKKQAVSEPGRLS